MFVSPAARRGRRALSALILLLLCLLAGAGCAARDRSAAVLTATGPLAPPTSTPTFTPTPTVPSPAPGLPTFKTVAAPDQTVLQSLAAAWAIDAERAPSAARLDAMQPYCRPNTPRAHWWVCTNDEGRVTALDLSFVQAGGEILSELRGLSALRYLNLSYNQLTALPPGVGPTPEPDISGSGPQPIDIPAAGTGPTHEPDHAVSDREPADGLPARRLARPGH